MPVEEAAWMAPGAEPRPVAFERQGQRVTVTVPSVRVYGILVIGRKGLDARRSARFQGDALMARAKMASGDAWQGLEPLLAAARGARERCVRPDSTPADTAAYARAAEALLRSVQQREDATYVTAAVRAGDPAGALLALDFGAKEAPKPWKAVGVDSNYSPETGYGWLPPTDGSEATPEERYYAMARRSGGKIPTELTAGRLPFWPYKEPPPAPQQDNIACGTPRRFRVDVAPGTYTVRVVTTNPSAMLALRNFLVSGMVSANGAVRLLDAPHSSGALVSREFPVAAPEGKIELTFGGPTGWAVAELLVKPGAATPDDPRETHGLRAWRVSPRYANPDWYPITQVSAAPERRLTRPPDPGWTQVAAPPAGLPVIDLGSNREAEVGDLVYAAATVRLAAPRTLRLHFAASSQAQLWLNGTPLGYVPNEKGLRDHEFALPVRLRAGENTLVVKLQRFWERRWQFCASLTPE
jgi:hypothetical protein